MPKKKWKTPAQTKEYKNLLELLSHVDLDIVPGASLVILVDKILEEEVKARMGLRYRDYQFLRRWGKHRKELHLTPETKVIAPEGDNILGV